MKKFLCLFLVFASIFCLCACGVDEEEIDFAIQGKWKIHYKLPDGYAEVLAYRNVYLTFDNGKVKVYSGIEYPFSGYEKEGDGEGDYVIRTNKDIVDLELSTQNGLSSSNYCNFVRYIYNEKTCEIRLYATIDGNEYAFEKEK